MNKRFCQYLACTFLIASAHASAQSLLEEVVVTAQKREQNISEVNLSVTAITGDALRELNMNDSVSIAAQTPGLNVGTPVGEGNNPSITLRGVGLNDFNDNNEGPIAVYRDEIYQSAMPGLNFQLFDLERVEVLRGPQGSLYGRNATGGLVHFISVKPTRELDGYGSFTYGEYDQIRFEGAVGGPLGDSFQGRLSMAYDTHDGYVKNRIGPDGNELNALAVRGQLNFDATDKLSFMVNVHHSVSDNIAPKYQHQVTDPGGVDYWGYVDTDNDNFAGEYDRDAVLNLENTGGSLTIKYQGEQFDLVSITAFESVDKIHAEDTDVGPIAGIMPTFRADVEQITQELRISGEYERMNWVAGLYYFDSEVDNTLDLVVNHFNGFINFLDNLSVEEGGFFLPPELGGPFNLLSGVTGADFTSNPDVLRPFLYYDVGYTQDTQSLGLFGQVDYNLTDKVNVSLGLRYTNEDRDFDYLNAYGDRNHDGMIDNRDGVLTNFLYLLQTDPVDPTPPQWHSYAGDIGNDNISGRLAVDYHPNEDLMLYLSYSRGFKSGGFNGGFLDFTDGVVPSDTPYDEETLNAFEFGFKSEWADHTVRFNGTAFYYDYQDFQALTFSGLSQFIDNSDAEVYGADFDLVWMPTENWDFQFGASLLSTEVDRVVVQGVPVTGTRMVLAPEFTINGLMRYVYPLWGNSSVSFQVDFNHQGDHYFDITNSPVSKEDDYTVFNARVAYHVNDNLTVALWGKNIGDEEYRVYTFDFTGPGGFNQQFFAPPRWFGGTVSYDF